MGYPVNYLIDYHALSSQEEIQRSFQPTFAYDWGNVGSLKGRAVCVLKLAIHTFCIALKPIYYLAIGTLMYLSVFLCTKLAALRNCRGGEALQEGMREALERQGEAQGRRFLNLLRAFENEDYVERMKNLSVRFIYTAPSAPISQLIQAGKAALGIIHPGYYFANDEMTPLFQRLKAVAEVVNCPADLVQKLDRGAEIIYSTLRDNPAADQYYALFKGDLREIAEKLEGDLSPAHKLSVLSMLHSDPDEPSGIEGCTPGFGRIIQQMKISLSMPEDLNRVVPWLLETFKIETIDRMVIESENMRMNEAGWRKIVAEIAHDQAHRGNLLTALLGREVGLSEEVVWRAEKDPLFNGLHLEAEDWGELLDAFSLFNSLENQIDALMGKINTQPDGSDGLKRLRNHIFQRLTEMVTPEESEGDEPSFYAAKTYYLHQGEGDPSDPQFTDLNRKAIAHYVGSLQLNLPRLNLIYLIVA